MKTFVLDTNVILHDPVAMFAFSGSNVVLPLTVIEELDNFKSRNDEKGRSARQISRQLDELRKIGGPLSDWVALEHGGKLKVEVNSSGGLPPTFSTASKDNQILSTAQHLRKNGEHVVFISKDINLRIKAEALGLETQDYEREKVDPEILYPGWREIASSPDAINGFYKNKKVVLPGQKFLPNEFAILKDGVGGSQSALGRFDAKAGALVPLTRIDHPVWGIKPLNTEQRFAFELLLNKDIELVSLVGVPGSGKTLLALAAGLHQTLDEKIYRRILVGRPLVAVGKDLGYLPGTKEEKLTNWMGAIYDNLSFLLEKPKGSLETSDMDLAMLIEDGTLEIEAVTFLRGRTLPGIYIIIDDAQNLTPHEIKTIISRAGKGSKIVLTGDPHQVDNYYLDASSNGLTNLVEKFKGQALFGHVTSTKTERSALAALASDLL